VNASEKNSRNDYRSMSEDRGTGNKDVKGLRTNVSGVSTQWVERVKPREKKIHNFLIANNSWLANISNDSL
jgi:hypothetical protein